MNASSMSALLVPSLRPGESVVGAKPLVRIGLDPDGLEQWLSERFVRVRGRAVVDRQHTRRATLDRAQANVRCDRKSQVRSELRP